MIAGGYSRIQSAHSKHVFRQTGRTTSTVFRCMPANRVIFVTITERDRRLPICPRVKSLLAGHSVLCLERVARQTGRAFRTQLGRTQLNKERTTTNGWASLPTIEVVVLLVSVAPLCAAKKLDGKRETEKLSATNDGGAGLKTAEVSAYSLAASVGWLLACCKDLP